MKNLQMSTYLSKKHSGSGSDSKAARNDENRQSENANSRFDAFERSQTGAWQTEDTRRGDRGRGLG